MPPFLQPPRRQCHHFGFDFGWLVEYFDGIAAVLDSDLADMAAADTIAGIVDTIPAEIVQHIPEVFQNSSAGPRNSEPRLVKGDQLLLRI